MKKVNDNTSNQQIIKLERRYDERPSYCADANGLLKGKWDDFRELKTKGPNNEAMFEIYYDRFLRWTKIDEYGFFYNIFSCKKYDGVLKMSDDLFICEKNGRLGIIDNKEKTILHTCYNNIKAVNSSTFLVDTETGMFIFNYQSKNTSEVYEEIIPSLYGYFVFKQLGKYGLLDNKGEIVLNPQYEKRLYNSDDKYQLQIRYKDCIFGIYVSNNLLYGKIPIDTYDLCFEVDHSYFVTKKGSKYGVLNMKYECVCDPCLDEIIPYKDKYWIKGNRTLYTHPDLGVIDILFIIGKKGDTYVLYNVQDCSCIIDGCQEIKYVRGNWMFIEYKKNDKIGYVTFAGFIIGEDQYDTIEYSHYNYIVSKSGKYGVITGEGMVMAACIYDKININNRGEFVAVKNGEELILNPRKIVYHDDDDEYEYERPTYGRYAGSYAQDEMGYSDDDIDTIFDGDPDAYWNID